MPQFLMAVGAVASVVGTASSVRAQREGLELQQEQEKRSIARSRRKAVREAQVRRATALASADAQGAGGSSGEAGGIGSLSSQLGEASGFSTSQSGLSREITKTLGRAATAGSIAALGGTVYNFGAAGGGTKLAKTLGLRNA